jgi:hypothetical protein
MDAIKTNPDTSSATRDIIQMVNVAKLIFFLNTEPFFSRLPSILQRHRTLDAVTESIYDAIVKNKKSNFLIF